MADTKRLKSTLAALLADNVVGAISAQDVRDVLESLDLSRGSLFWTGFATTTLTLQGSGGAGGTNYYLILGTTTTKTLNRFAHASPGRLTYNGPVSIRADLFAVFSLSLSGLGTADLALEFAINGTAQAPGYQMQKVSLGVATQFVLLTEATLAPGDYVEVWAACETAPAKVLTPIAGVVQIQEMPLE